jgi:hypothetical protein
MRNLQRNIQSDMPNVLKFVNMVSLGQNYRSDVYEPSSESVTRLRA